MRDGFVFYRSFFECFEDLSKKDKLILFDALCNYALNDVEPKLDGVPAAIFKLLKPQVDANIRRYENGKKGGRPKQNQDETKEKPNDNLTITKAEPKYKDKDKVKYKDKSKDKEQLQPQDKATGSVGGGGSDDDEFNIWKRMSPKDVDAIFKVYPESGGYLIDAVYADVKAKKKDVKDPVTYILGYARNVKWDDSADHMEVI